VTELKRSKVDNTSGMRSLSLTMGAGQTWVEIGTLVITLDWGACSDCS